MKKHLLLFLGVFIVICTADHRVEIINNCTSTIWLAILCHTTGEAFSLPFNGGLKMNPTQSVSVNLPIGWGGRFWGRTNCNDQGVCQTGDCGNRLECSGLSGKPPCTLAEITFDGGGNADWYDISNVDGFNLPISMSPVLGTFQRRSDDHYDCGNASCPVDINKSCPPELQVSNGTAVIACDSACNRFNKDEYCCRGAFNDPQKCIPRQWDQNYAAVFKNACPDAYSYAYDDHTSTFVCVGKPSADYIVTFC